MRCLSVLFAPACVGWTPAAVSKKILQRSVSSTWPCARRGITPQHRAGRTMACTATNRWRDRPQARRLRPPGLQPVTHRLEPRTVCGPRPRPLLLSSCKTYAEHPRGRPHPGRRGSRPLRRPPAPGRGHRPVPGLAWPARRHPHRQPTPEWPLGGGRRAESCPDMLPVPWNSLRPWPLCVQTSDYLPHSHPKICHGRSRHWAVAWLWFLS